MLAIAADTDNVFFKYTVKNQTQCGLSRKHFKQRPKYFFIFGFCPTAIECLLYS